MANGIHLKVAPARSKNVVNVRCMFVWCASRERGVACRRTDHDASNLLRDSAPWVSVRHLTAALPSNRVS